MRLAERARLYLTLGEHVRMALLGPARVGWIADRMPRITSGLAAFSILPHSDRLRLEIEAGERTITVHGTKFAFEVRAGRLQGLRYRQAA